MRTVKEVRRAHFEAKAIFAMVDLSDEEEEKERLKRELEASQRLLESFRPNAAILKQTHEENKAAILELEEQGR